MTITEEMVEKAQKAWWGPQRDDYHPYQIAMRAALEAVAPMLIAQGMREAAEKVWHSEDRELILARAQELEGKLICDCCKREVDYVRSSMWHGDARICRECFFEWYDPSGPVTDEDITSPIRIGNRVRAKFKLEPLELDPQ